MATQSLEIRFDDTVIFNATKAAYMKGMSDVSEYVVSLVEADSKKTIDRQEPIVLSHEDFENFIEAYESSDEPNQRLIEARDLARKQGLL